uniref:Uncharacterized protein n=1 Tax=Meloidogyne javanica TaxID=6303 RepID=A0A915M7U4_MELJA
MTRIDDKGKKDSTTATSTLRVHRHILDVLGPQVEEEKSHEEGKGEGKREKDIGKNKGEGDKGKQDGVGTKLVEAEVSLESAIGYENPSNADLPK